MEKNQFNIKRLTKEVELEMRNEEWCGYNIRFFNIEGEWMAVLKDVADAVGIQTAKLAQRIPDQEMLRVPVKREFKQTSKNVSIRTSWMVITSEAGVYRALLESRKLEARKFVTWTTDVLKKLRKTVGLEGYEVFRMTEPEIQDDIDWILDCLYVDTETQQVMVSVTLPGGDVDQVPLEEYKF